MRDVFETGNKDSDVQERQIGHGEFGDIRVRRMSRNGVESLCAEKDYRGDVERGQHAYSVWFALHSAGVPTFTWYERSSDRDDVISMPFVGSPSRENGKHVPGDILCATPLQRSEGMNILEKEGLAIDEENIDALCINVLEIIRGADAINAELTHDSVLFRATYHENTWKLSEIFIGDFDAVSVHGEEAGYISPRELHENNLMAVVGTTRHFVEEFCKKSSSMTAEGIGDLLKESVRIGRTLSEEEKKRILEESTVPLVAMNVTSWDDL